MSKLAIPLSRPFRRTSVLGIGVLLSAFLAGAKSVQAQVVQLPSFQFFSTDSSVLVPDRGTASLGGVMRSSSGSNQFGPPFLPSNRSYGNQTGAMGSMVSVKIHDFEAMDEALLAGSPAARRPAELAGGAASAGPLASVAELAARRQASQAVDQAEAAQLLERGLKAQAEGKPGAAKVYLQMAAKRSSGKLKQQVLAALAAGNPPLSEASSSRVGSNHGNRTAATAKARN